MYTLVWTAMRAIYFAEIAEKYNGKPVTYAI